jgi:lipopolysaccharide exporter
VLATPAAVVFALLSADLVALLYGPAWMESAWVLAVLFLCLPAWACWGLSTPVLWNTGRKHLESTLQLPLLALAAPAWWLAAPAWWFLAPTGIRGVALVSAAVIFARAIVIIGAALHALQLRWSSLLPYLWRGFMLSVVCGLAVLAGQQVVSSIKFPGMGLYAGATCALVAMLIVLVVRPAMLGPEAQIALGRILPRFRFKLADAVAVKSPGEAR